MKKKGIIRRKLLKSEKKKIKKKYSKNFPSLRIYDIIVLFILTSNIDRYIITILIN